MLALRETTDRIADDLARTRSLISGEGDTSVVSQMARIRTEIRDNVGDVRKDLGRMNEAFTSFGTDIRQEIRDFAAKVSEVSSRELIKALEDVIRDFNSKLTEQFGENFKRLDDSVAKLVIWQENYRIHLEELKAQFEAARQGIADTQAAIEAIRRDTEAIPQTMQGLRDLFVRLDTQISELERHLDAFTVMRERASSAVPELKQHLERVFENVAGSVDQSQRHFQELQTRTGQLLDGFSTEAQSLEKRLTEMLNERIETVGARLELTARNLEERQAAAQGSLERSAETMVAGALSMTTRWEQVLADTTTAAARVGSGLETAVSGAAETLRIQLERTFEETRTAIDASLASLDGEAKRIGGSLEQSMTRAASTLDRELNESFDRMRTSVTGSVDKLNAETEKVAERYREAGAVIERAGTDVASQAAKLTQTWEKVLESAAESLESYSESFDEELRKASAALSQRLEDALKQERTRILELSNAMREEAKRAAGERTEILNAELRNLDEAMQKELTRALQQMGEQLARITRKFVDDYEQLITRMEQALRTVERLEKTKG